MRILQGAVGSRVRRECVWRSAWLRRGEGAPGNLLVAHCFALRPAFPKWIAGFYCYRNWLDFLLWAKYSPYSRIQNGVTTILLNITPSQF